MISYKAGDRVLLSSASLLCYSPLVPQSPMIPHLSRCLKASIALAGAVCGTSLRASPDSIVTFSEVHYNPSGASEDSEWVEIHNQMAIRVDLSGWKLSGGVNFTFIARWHGLSGGGGSRQPDNRYD